ncbi:MAG: S8 family peptidase [Aureispira sp.]
MAYCSHLPSDIVLRPGIKTLVMDWGMDLLDIPSYWKLSKGEGVRIAVLDTGVALTHPNLEGVVVKAVDFTESRTQAEDNLGHGTHCIGIISARECAKGTVGIAPRAEIYSAKVVSDKGVSSITSLVKGIEWAIKMKVHIISISLACDNDSESMKQAIDQAVAAGIFVVAAVGNDKEDYDAIKFPAKYKEVIAVGAIDRQLNVTACSSQGIGINLVAPGEGILSTYLPDTFAEMNGTSTAVPFVVGTLALFLSKYKKDTQRPIKEHYQRLKKYFLSSTIKLGSLKENKAYGKGLIDPQKLFDSLRWNELTQ